MTEPIPIYSDLVLDGEAVRNLDGNYRIDSLQGWEEHLAGTGKRLPTVGEYIITFKHLDEINYPALQGILQDLRESSLCAGKIDYIKSNIPAVSGYLDELMNDSACKNALEDEVFHDDAQEAVSFLYAVSGKRPYLWTPDAAGRKSHPKRAVWVYISTDRFGLYCNINPINNIGRARGMRTSVSEQKAPLGATAEIKLLQAPVTTSPQNDVERFMQNIYDPKELAYATGLLNGSSSGTVMDWKKH